MPHFSRSFQWTATVPVWFTTGNPVVWLVVELMLTALCGRACALTIDSIPEAQQMAGTHSSLAVVDGRPAIAWAAGNFESVKYARALDAAGAAWGPPVVVDMGENTGRYINLIVADGNPAVCYIDETLGKLRFARALDAQGSVWEDPRVVETAPEVPASIAMEVVGGSPAVCFATAAGLKYLRASNAQGSAWGSVQTPDSSAAGGEVSMKVVQGNPVVVYSGPANAAGSWNIYYIFAVDGIGSAWVEPRRVDTLTSLTRPPALSLEIVGGLPAIAIGKAFPSAGEIRYQRATSVQGFSWSLWRPTALHMGTGTPALAVIGGRPAVAFFDTLGSDLAFVHAQESTGEGNDSWSMPVVVDSAGTVGLSPSLREINGLPAIVYLNPSKKTLEYVRASGQAGNLRWPAQLQVTKPPGFNEPLISGTTHDFKVVAVGWSPGVIFDLFNPNEDAEDLEVTRYAFEGPDAAEFSLLFERPSPPYTLKPADWAGGPASIIVQIKPLTPGYKNALLRIEHSGNPSPFTIALKADVNPHLSLTPLGKEIESGRYQLDLPPTHPGSPQEFVFTIHNYGGAELNSLAVTIDGPDAAEFSVSSPPPAAPVPPLGRTTFNVRHTTLTTGSKTAALRVASNAVEGFSQTTLRLIAGALDSSFEAERENIEGLALQPDGKILTAGKTLRRLLPGGGSDPSFFMPVIQGIQGIQFTAFTCVAVQRDGRILAGGNFTHIDGQPRGYFVRLLADGSVDTSFAPVFDSVVYCIAIQPDGKILVGGEFGAVPDGVPGLLARLNEDGSIDTAFAPGIGGGGAVSRLLLQPDGKILVVHLFVPAGKLVRLHSDGSPELSFAVTVEPSALALLPDGRVLAGGGGNTTLERFLPNGFVDPVPLPQPDSTVHDLVMQADGACLAAGYFDSIGGQLRSRAARLRSDGFVDAGFEFYPNDFFGNSYIRRLALQAGGRVLLTAYNQAENGGPLLRLANDPAVSVVERDAVTNTVRWRLGGTAPAVSDASFDFKPLRTTAWTPLGFGKPVAGGWELDVSGLTIPAQGTLRARGRAGGSLIEANAYFLPPLEMWRVGHFQTPDATGDAANDADPDKDGLTNLAEFAFGLSPVDARDGREPMFELTPGTHGNPAALTATFPAPPGRDNILYAAEQSTTLLPGTWTPIPDTGTGNEHTFRTAPYNGNGTAADKLFVRFVLSLRPE